MKALISHYFHSNIDEILEKSLLNCHCFGLHSIMLSESPGKTIRLYITDKSHELWKNSNGEVQSIAYHPHHCDLTLHCIYGAFGNITTYETSRSGGIAIDRFIYHSKISGGKMGFEKTGKTWIMSPVLNIVGHGEHVFMSAKEVHTVFCSKGTVNAWLVYEGVEDKNYIPYCWSNKDLTKETGDGLYVKASHKELSILLKSIGAI
jgi:hypothetical protein